MHPGVPTPPGYGNDHDADHEQGTRLPEPAAVIVVGAHLVAELYDRPIAYRLQRAFEKRLIELGGQAGMGTIVVCTDLWYLNQEALRVLPTVTIGGPNNNAATAFWAEKLPTVIAVDGVYVVQLDEGHGIPVAACWGMEARTTLAAVEQFEKKWLDHFLGAIAA
jgi:hypothetical protein